MSSHKNILFVDYENVGKVDLNAIPADVHVPFFFGASQKTVPTDFMRAALKLGPRFFPIDIEGQGTNALDFHIAFYLGEYLAANAQANCIILSKDKGFDPLVKHLCGRDFNVRRAATIAEAFKAAKPKGTAAPSPQPKPVAKSEVLSPLASALKWLSEMEERKRPQKRKGLIAYLNTRFRKKIPEPELQKLVDRMIEERKISDVNGTLGYALQLGTSQAKA